MGLLVDGVWQDQWYDTKSSGGKFERSQAKFRNWITADGSAGPSGKSGFKAESGRYHLYVSLACPWAHRTLIFRQIKDLTSHIGVSVVHPDMLGEGCTFEVDDKGATGDHLFDLPYARDIYIKADPNFTGRVTVPILWDKAQNTIVSNESSEIIRMFNTAFDSITGNAQDYWPGSLRAEIAPVNDRIYDTLNNGVYKSGFATTQNAYDAAVHPLFETLDWIEGILSENRYLMGVCSPRWFGLIWFTTNTSSATVRGLSTTLTYGPTPANYTNGPAWQRPSILTISYATITTVTRRLTRTGSSRSTLSWILTRHMDAAENRH